MVGVVVLVLVGATFVSDLSSIHDTEKLIKNVDTSKTRYCTNFQPFVINFFPKIAKIIF